MTCNEQPTTNNLQPVMTFSQAKIDLFRRPKSAFYLKDDLSIILKYDCFHWYINILLFIQKRSFMTVLGKYSNSKNMVSTD